MNRKSKQLDVLVRNIGRLDTRIKRLQSISLRYSRIRLMTVLIVSVGAVFFFQQTWSAAGWGWLFTGTLVFFVLVYLHDKALRSLVRHRHWRAIKQGHVSRMRLDWPNMPEPLNLNTDPGHPFELDLNLTGKRSMHQLMNTASSRSGGERLAEWMLACLPDPDCIASRQRQVKELAGNGLFRDRMVLAGKLVSANDEAPWEGDALLAWVGARPRSFNQLPLLRVLIGFSVANAALIVLNVVGVLPAWWMATLPVYGALYLLTHRSFGFASHDAFKIERGLKRFRSVWAYLEAHHYQNMPHTAALCVAFTDPAARPSKALGRIERIAAFVNFQMAAGGLMAPLLNTLFPWDLFFTHRLHLAKQSIRDHLPKWLDVWHELEALCAMATFADLHPDYVYPVIQDTPSDTKAVFRAKAVGHRCWRTRVK